ncbi:MAG: MFS transporter [Rhodospirillaceae bacterium]|nr:MFS transporter [Rhodospirillaceae bacterium]MBT6090375.1 MFS transporter [Rhodospirillaceae bacterium]
MNADTDTPPDTSIWSLLRIPLFRWIWIGICLSNLGYWMQTITAAWLMKDWTNGDPILVSLVQTAYFLPTVLLIVAAGTLADTFDRRRLLIFANIWMMVAAALLAVLIFMGNKDPVMLLALSGLLAVGFALNQPTQSAVVPEIVGQKNVPYAVSLYSVANNGARVLGPGIAGVLIPIVGGAALIGMNAATYVFLLAVLIWWRRTPQAADTSGESFLSAMGTGFRFVRQSDRLRTVMLRGGLFFAVTSIIIAMMPMLVPNSADYGLVFGCFGMGAITGALNYGRLSIRYSRNSIVLGAIIIHAVMLVLLSATTNSYAMGAILLCAGTAWFFVMSALQISAQLILPNEVRGRGIAILNMTLMAGYALGSPVWGTVAAFTTPRTSMLIAGCLSLIFLALTYRMPFPQDSETAAGAQS